MKASAWYTLLLSALLLTVLAPQTTAMDLGHLDGLFPFFSGDNGHGHGHGHGDSQQNAVNCDLYSLQLLCQTCPAHSPVCALDLGLCSWDCLPRNAD